MIYAEDPKQNPIVSFGYPSLTRVELGASLICPQCYCYLALLRLAIATSNTKKQHGKEYCFIRIGIYAVKVKANGYYCYDRRHIFS